MKLTKPAQTRSPVVYARLVGSLILFALGSWWIGTQHAKFILGGDPDSAWASRRGTGVDAKGLDAVAIGCAAVGLGLVNLAVGLRTKARLPVFWVGAAILGATAAYGIGLFVKDVVDFVKAGGTR